MPPSDSEHSFNVTLPSWSLTSLRRVTTHNPVRLERHLPYRRILYPRTNYSTLIKDIKCYSIIQLLTFTSVCGCYLPPHSSILNSHWQAMSSGPFRGGSFRGVTFTLGLIKYFSISGFSLKLQSQGILSGASFSIYRSV